MEALESLDRKLRFKSPDAAFADIGAEAVGELLATVVDVAFIVDAGGIIRDVAIGSDGLVDEGFEQRAGKAWVDTVTIESREKVEEMIAAATSGGPFRWRQVNHPTKGGPDIPVRYLARRIGGSDLILAVGRELRSVAALQQRLVETQQSMEREYARLRQAEMRYRLLFHMASEPVLVVSAANMKVQEANPAALTLLGRSAERTTGRLFAEFFDTESARAVERQLAALHASGETAPVAACLREGAAPCMVSASLFRRDDTTYYLVRLATPEAGSGIVVSKSETNLRGVMENLPDGFVVTDLDLRILTCNASFLDLIQLSAEDQAKGENLERWLGRGSIDANSILVNLREHGTVRNFATYLHSEYGADEDVEITAVSVPKGEAPCLGFIVRHVPRLSKDAADMPSGLPRSVDQLTELVGRVPLKDLVREATDVIERLCIEASLQLTRDNRASAAQMLGLSRQSFYAKLRRYGLGDLDS